MVRLFQVDGNIVTGKRRELVLKEYSLDGKEPASTLHLIEENNRPKGAFTLADAVASTFGSRVVTPAPEQLPVGTVVVLSIAPLDPQAQPEVSGIEKTVAEHLI